MLNTKENKQIKVFSEFLIQNKKKHIFRNRSTKKKENLNGENLKDKYKT